MNISVIIPTLNEAEHIGRLVSHLKMTAPSPGCEVLVVDGCSTDDTRPLAEDAGAKVISCMPCGRARQMNMGAKSATGEWLYFVHADVLPPHDWGPEIQAATASGACSGCFSYRFDSDSKLLKINALATRRNSFLSGGGDQTLFVSRKIFEQLGGFRNELCIMEDFDFVWRLKQKHAFRVIQKDALVSVRKYTANGYLKVQLVNLVTVVLFRLGLPAGRLQVFYKKMLASR